MAALWSHKLQQTNEAADELSILDNIVGSINTSGTTLLNGATPIGTLSVVEGTVTNAAALTITFNGAATNALVQQVLQAIHYRNTSEIPGEMNRTVTVTATDTNAASVSDTRTITVTTVNDPGEATITGTATEDQKLTASVTDDEGTNNAATTNGFSYQWKRNGNDIPGATLQTYILVQGDVGNTITVTVGYTDDLSNIENVISGSTAVVTNINDPGSVTILGTAEEDQTLTADVTDTDGLVDGNGFPVNIIYQWKRGGVDISGAVVRTYVLVQADVNKAVTVSASYTDGGGTSESVLSAATNNVVDVAHVPMGNVDINNLNPSQGDTLTVSDTLSDADIIIGGINYQWKRGVNNILGATAETYVLVQKDVDEIISVIASYTDGGGAVESVISRNATATVINVNDAPTGVVGIDNSSPTLPTEGQTLTVNTTLLDDEDDFGDFTYKWKRTNKDGITIDIPGATSTMQDTYVLVQDDVGQTITVTVSYTDGGETAESVTQRCDCNGN